MSDDLDRRPEAGPVAGQMVAVTRRCQEVSRRFLAQARRPADLGDVDVATLRPHQRTLLTSGRTVDALEAHSREPLHAILVDQNSRVDPVEADCW